MKTVPTRLGDVLELERIPIAVDPTKKYTQIGIRSFGRGIFHRDTVPGSDLSKLRYFEVCRDRMIVSNIMAWEGAIAVSGDNDDGCVGSSRFLSYKATGDVELTYLNYFFQSDSGRRLIAQASTGTVKRNQVLSPRNFEALKVPLPPIGEQQRIAVKLHSAFKDTSQIADHHRNVESLRARVLHSCLRNLPRRPLGTGLSIRNGETEVSPSERYKICGIYSFGRGLIRRPAIYGEETAYKHLTRIQPGLVVMSKLNAWEGALAVVPEDFADYYVSPEYPVFEIDDSVVDQAYVSHLMKWPVLWDQLTPRGSMVRRKRTPPNRLREVEVPLPDLDEQRRIAGILDRVEEAGKLAAHQRTVLDALRQSLLNAAFSGQL